MHFPLTVFWWLLLHCSPADDDFLQFFTPPAFNSREENLFHLRPSVFSKGVSYIYECSLYILYWRLHLQWGMLLCVDAVCEISMALALCVCMFNVGWVNRSREKGRQQRQSACPRRARFRCRLAARGEKERFWWFLVEGLCAFERLVSNFYWGRGSWRRHVKNL